jgi:hypothetical protein
MVAAGFGSFITATRDELLERARFRVIANIQPVFKWTNQEKVQIGDPVRNWLAFPKPAKCEDVRFRSDSGGLGSVAESRYLT